MIDHDRANPFTAWIDRATICPSCGVRRGDHHYGCGLAKAARTISKRNNCLGGVGLAEPTSPINPQANGESIDVCVTR